MVTKQRKRIKRWRAEGVVAKQSKRIKRWRAEGVVAKQSKRMRGWRAERVVATRPRNHKQYQKHRTDELECSRTVRAHIGSVASAFIEGDKGVHLRVLKD